jgi:hypothetical protein
MSTAKQEIKTFIFSQNINTLLVSETYFTSKSYFRIPGLYYTTHIVSHNAKLQELPLS